MGVSVSVRGLLNVEKGKAWWGRLQVVACLVGLAWGFGPSLEDGIQWRAISGSEQQGCGCRKEIQVAPFHRGYLYPMLLEDCYQQFLASSGSALQERGFRGGITESLTQSLHL